jgi:hypothetical protein
MDQLPKSIGRYADILFERVELFSSARDNVTAEL